MEILRPLSMYGFNRIGGFLSQQGEEINDSEGWPEAYHHPANEPFMVTGEELSERMRERWREECRARMLHILRQRQGIVPPSDGTGGVPEFSLN